MIVIGDGVVVFIVSDWDVKVDVIINSKNFDIDGVV